MLIKGVDKLAQDFIQPILNYNFKTSNNKQILKTSENAERFDNTSSKINIAHIEKSSNDLYNSYQQKIKTDKAAAEDDKKVIQPVGSNFEY